MDRDAVSTTVPLTVQVRIEFVTRDTDDMRDESDASDCGVRCCFNQRRGCPLDQDDERCAGGAGYYTVREVIKYG